MVKFASLTICSKFIVLPTTTTNQDYKFIRNNSFAKVLKEVKLLFLFNFVRKTNPKCHFQLPMLQIVVPSKKGKKLKNIRFGKKSLFIKNNIHLSQGCLAQ
jgi:hypothetical protein